MKHVGTADGVEIRLLHGEGEAEACAAMMAGSEPWMTLGRGYDESLRLVTDPAREVYVALSGGELVGLVVIVMSGAFTGYIQSICVAPHLRSRGIGGRLMAFAEARILRESPNVFLCVSDFNAGAQRFYERLGYETVGTLRDYLVEGLHEVLMRKTVAPITGYRNRCP
ncbi:GNAT family N-acetyltransferase [Candidatus Bathyarchaeota archaeon]|nr:GNAT family N-acetyltransferase [Candidatus Bathyarchaeota archaeon]